MFKETSNQRTIYRVEYQMGGEKRKRLERSWAEQFRNEVLPLIDEKKFKQFYCPDNGRPNVSVRMIVGTLLLKETKDLTDKEVLNNLEWHEQYRYALDVDAEDAHTCQKTLHNFREKLLQSDQGKSLFEDLTKKIAEKGKLRLGRQRLDSTHIISNMARLGRLGLFVKTIEGFLKRLKKNYRDIFDKLPERFNKRYLDRKGYFADVKSSESRRRLDVCARGIFYLLDRFRDHEIVSKMEKFHQLRRLFEDQCEIAEGEGTEEERIILRKKVSSGSMQNPSDEDATYGHKGKGYEAQVSESCGEENPFEVITHVDVTDSNKSDQEALVGVIENLEESGMKPEDMHTDAGFGSGKNIVAASDRGVNLHAPLPGKSPEGDKLQLADFTFNDEDTRILQCPNFKEPIEHRQSKNGKKTEAIFSHNDCLAFELKDRCPTICQKKYRKISFTREEVATSKRHCEQETKEFKEAHKIRSGGEATNSELKRRHGLGHLRVRRKPRVKLAVNLYFSENCSLKPLKIFCCYCATCFFSQLLSGYS